MLYLLRFVLGGSISESSVSDPVRVLKSHNNS